MPYGGGNRVFPPHFQNGWGGNLTYSPPISKTSGGGIGVFPPQAMGGENFWAPQSMGGEKKFGRPPPSRWGGDKILAPNWPKNDVNCREKPDFGPILQNLGGGTNFFMGGGQKSSPPHAMGGEACFPTRIQTSWGGNVWPPPGFRRRGGGIFLVSPPTMGGNAYPWRTRALFRSMVKLTTVLTSVFFEVLLVFKKNN